MPKLVNGLAAELYSSMLLNVPNAVFVKTQHVCSLHHECHG